MKQIKSNKDSTYRIRLKETVQHSAIDWFNHDDIFLLENGETLLIAQFPDQPALRGFLDQLWNLNFTILSFELVENKNDPDAVSRQP